MFENVCNSLANIKNLVTNKSSVPKEQVYPRFDALGYLWIRLYEEVLVMTARANAFRTLCMYRLSFHPTLSEEYYDEETQKLSLGDDNMLGFAIGAPEQITGGDAPGTQPSVAPVDDSVAEGKDGDMSKKNVINNDADAKDGGSSAFDNGTSLLSVHNTPDFMMLPLELQGFCPWTIVNAN